MKKLLLSILLVGATTPLKALDLGHLLGYSMTTVGAIYMTQVGRWMQTDMGRRVPTRGDFVFKGLAIGQIGAGTFYTYAGILTLTAGALVAQDMPLKCGYGMSAVGCAGLKWYLSPSTARPIQIPQGPQQQVNHNRLRAQGV